MALVRVPVSGTIGKAVRINPDATVGSQIGVDLQLPDDSIPDLAGLALALYAASPPNDFPDDGDSSGSAGFVFETDIIDGVLLARVADDETITGAWQFDGITNFNANVNINGATFSIFDSSGADSLAASHDGVDFDFAFTGTQQVQFTGAVASYQFDNSVAIVKAGSASFSVADTSGSIVTAQLFPASLEQSGAGAGTFIVTGMNSLRFLGGLELRVTDATSADWLGMSHDGVDFSFAFVNTADWNVTGIAGFNVVNYNFDVDQTVGAGQDNHILTYDNASGLISLEAAAVSVLNDLDDVNLTFLANDAFMVFNSITGNWEDTSNELSWTGALFDIVGNLRVVGTGVNILAGETRIRDDATTDWVALDHDGADFNIAGVNTANINITGITAILAGTVDADFDAITGTSIGTGLGTVGAPSRFFEGDLDTGDYSPGADIYAISAGAVDAVRYIEAGSSVLQLPQADLGLTGGEFPGDVILASSYNVFTTIGEFTNNSVTLPPIFAVNTIIYIKNDGAFSVDLAPSSGDDLGLGIDIVLSLKPGKGIAFIATVANSTWTELLPIATDDPLLLTAGFVSYSFLGDTDTGVRSPAPDIIDLIAGGAVAVRYTEVGNEVLWAPQTTVGLTADVGSSQGDGLILSSYNIYSTVANAGDAATLPVSFTPGTTIYDKNNGSNSMDVFPSSGDDAGAGTDVAVAVAVGESATFIGIDNNATWTELIVGGGTEINDLTVAVTWANVPDANITEGSVTQHEAALTILESQITDGSLLARIAADESISATNWTFENPLLFDAGGVGAPGLGIDGDADTGVFSPAADAIAFTVGAVEAIRFTEAGNSVLQAPEANVGLTADVGSSQGDGVITSSYNVYSIVANAGDAATLPATFIVDTLVFVKNDGANSMDVFPASGDDAGSGTNTAVAVAAGESAAFIATAANSTWTPFITGVPGATGPAGTGSAILGHSGSHSVIAKGSTDYIGFGSGGVQSVEADAEFYVPIAGTVRNLRTYVSANASNNAGNNITVRKNGSGTSLGTTYGAAETGLKSDTSDSFTVVAGDRIAIEFVNAGSGGGNKDIDVETVTMELA